MGQKREGRGRGGREETVFGTKLLLKGPDPGTDSRVRSASRSVFKVKVYLKFKRSSV